MLCDAIGQAAAAVRLAVPDGTGRATALTFGAPQGTDVRPIRRDDLAGTGQPLNYQAVANYIAKYATKTLTAPGVPCQRLRHLVEIQALRCSGHYKQMITTAWQLGGKRQTGEPRFRQWAHMLGYGGHFLTKSRRYSVTFGQLRQARTDHRHQQRHPDGERDPWGRPVDDAVVLVLKTWRYAGTGYTPATPGAELAIESAVRARGHRGPGRHHQRRFTVKHRLTANQPTEGEAISHMNPRNERLLTLAQAAEALGEDIKPRFVRRLVAERRIRFTHIGRYIRIPESAVREFIDAGMVEPVSVHWHGGKVVA